MRLTGRRAALVSPKFQSTHPVWGATRPVPYVVQGVHHFNPRTPCGVRLTRWLQVRCTQIFQSTHPVWGATRSASFKDAVRSLFQSTHPVWGATTVVAALVNWWKFQSTHPVWGATPGGMALRHFNLISIHAPRVGCDETAGEVTLHDTNFNPRTPCGVRQRRHCYEDNRCTISIHAPRVGCDENLILGALPPHYFNPRTPCGVRRAIPSHSWSNSPYFNPRTPCGVRRLPRPGFPMGRRFQSTHPVWGATEGPPAR